MKRARIASLVVAAAFAVAPAAALGQGAGGTQYTDPLDPGTPSSPSTPSTPSTPSGPSATSPGATASAPSTATGAPASAQAAGTAGTGEIPRTGFPVGMLMFAGVLCLSGGLALRRAAGTTGA